MAMRWRALEGYKGVQVAHAKDCPQNEAGSSKRCRCRPRYRRLAYDSARGRTRPGPTTDRRSAALAFSWPSSPPRPAGAGASRTFGDVAQEWFELFEQGRIAKRRGSGRPSPTTVAGYRAVLHGAPRDADGQRRRTAREPRRQPLLEEWGHRPGDEIADIEWQRWVDSLARAGISRSRIDELLAVVRGVYAYATRSTRRIWAGNDPTRFLDLPVREERKRTRVAPVPEARELLAALPDDVAMPYAIAIGAGLRRSEMAALEWRDVLWDANKVVVRRSKSDAGRLRRAPVSKLGMQYLREEHLRQGRPAGGPVLRRSLLSGHLQGAAEAAWVPMNARRGAAGEEPIERITLHEGRHTYASMLMAAGYTLVEIMAFMGHADLAATQRYLKKLPQPNELDESARLHTYEAGFPPAQTA